MVSLLHVFITQWYSKDEQECLISEQFFFNDLLFHSLPLRGQEPTIVAVAATDSLHSVAFLPC